MNLGIIGLAQTGKKTVFRLLTGLAAEGVAQRGGVRYGMASVRDPRVDVLVGMYNPKKTKYAAFEIALPPDVQPGVARGADWIEPLRKADGYIHVVRAFASDSVFHPAGSVNPARDIATVDTELLLADLGLAEKRLERMAREMKKKGDNLAEREKEALERIKAWLEEEKPLRQLALTEDELKLVRNLQFLTLKPMIAVLNAGEDLGGTALGPVEEALKAKGVLPVRLSAALEAEMEDLDEAARKEFMKDLGLAEPAAHRLSRAAYENLGLLSFFTVGEDEVRAWPLRRGSSALEAAGTIHTDLARGFIRAETVAYADLVKAGSEKAAKERNLQKLNGKEYVVLDGDVLNIRFNV